MSSQPIDDDWDSWYAAVSDESASEDFGALPEPVEEPAVEDGSEAGAPGIRTVTATNPTERGHELAEELDAQLVEDPAEATDAISARIAAAHRLQDDRDSSEFDAPTVGRLRQLGDELTRADRIRSQTEVVVAETLARRLSTSTGITVHPTSLRNGAEAVVAADRRVDSAKGALAALGTQPDTMGGVGGIDTSDIQQPDDDDSPTNDRTKQWVVIAGVALVVVVAVLVAVGVLPWYALIAAGGVAVAVAVGIVRRGRAAEADTQARHAAAANLDLANATAVKARAVAEASRAATEDWHEKHQLLEITLERAESDQRSARRSWESLAGPEADPYDIESVLKMYDAQYEIAPVSLNASPAVRTAHAFHRRAHARWRVAWAAIGCDEPPAADAIDETLAKLQPAGTSVRSADDKFNDVDLVSRPLVLVDPYRGMDDDAAAALRDELKRLSPDCSVVIVEPAAEAATDSGAEDQEKD